MKLALLVILAGASALAAVIFLVPESTEARRDPAPRREDSRSPPPRGATSGVIDLSSARGEDVFSPQMAEAVVDGETTSYQSLILWCATISPLADQRFLLRDVRVIVNPKPRSRGDLARLVMIPPDTPPEHVGPRMLDLLGKTASGARAAQAVFHGGRDLASAERVELEEGVQLFLMNPADRGSAWELNTPAMTLEMNQGRLVRAWGTEALTLRSSHGVLEGTGIEILPDPGLFVLQQAIRGRLEELDLLGRQGPAVEIVGGGPLQYQPAEPPTQPVEIKAPGRFLLEGGVELTQGAASIRGDRLSIATAGAPLKIAAVTVQGHLEARLPQGEFKGDRLQYTAPSADGGGGQITVSGPPVQVILPDAAGVLPGVGGGDLTVSSSGTAVLQGLGAPSPSQGLLTIGPDVQITGPEVEAHGNFLEVTLAEVPSNRAGAAPGDLTTFPALVVFRGDVTGHSPSGHFRGGILTYQRLFSEQGLPLQDELDLRSSPEIGYVMTPLAGSGARTPSELLEGGGAVVVRATDRISLRRDPLRVGTTSLQGRGQVEVKRLGPDGEKDVLGWLRAREVDLLLEEVWRPRRHGLTARFEAHRRILGGEARGEVAFVASNRWEGKGERLHYLGPSGDVILQGHPSGLAADLRVFEPPGEMQSIKAPTIRYLGGVGALVAEAGAEAAILAPQLGYGDPGDRMQVPTTIQAARITVWYERREAEGSPEIKPREALAEVGVQVLQEPGGVAKGDYLRLDLRRREATLRGMPARLEVLRRHGAQDYREYMVASQLTVLDREALASGGVEARFYVDPRALGLNLPSLWRAQEDPSGAARPSPPDLVPLDVLGEGDLLLSERSLLLQGPATISQGDPDQQGFLLKGGQVILFLAELLPQDSRPLEVVRAVVDGEVHYLSHELTCQGDVLELDRLSKRLFLYALQGTATLSMPRIDLRGHQRPAFTVDFSDPRNPYVESLDRPPKRSPR